MYTDSKENVHDLVVDQIKAELEARRLKQEQDDLRKRMLSAPPFSAAKSSAQARKARVEKSKNDFWYFDKTYFPKENYQDYTPPGKFHRDLIDITNLTDKRAHVLAGPRDHAKTAHFKKDLIYKIIFGKRNYIQFASETLTTPAAFVLDTINYLLLNDRLNYDYKIDVLESGEKLFIRTDQNPRGTYLDILSEKRSSRGKNRGLFLRPDYIFITDFENATSSFSDDAIVARISRLNEMRTSLAVGGVLVWEGNNFDVDCAMNRLFKEEEAGLLSANIVLHRYAAWDGSRPPMMRSLWYKRYPAKSEQQLMDMLKPLDKHDWAGNYQQSPVKKSGDIFPDTYYKETDAPGDLLAVIYCDPNLSLKSKGDTTAVGCFGFSFSRMEFYLTAARCRSYSRSNDLLDDLLIMYRDQRARGVRVVTVGFDGNVNQESTWTNNLYNYMQLNNLLFPHVEFRRYKVDELTKNAELDYKQSKFNFPVGFSKTEEGKRFVKQFFAFKGKKAKRKDDAPDMLICAYELLHEMNLVKSLRQTGDIYSVSNRKLTDRF